MKKEIPLLIIVILAIIGFILVDQLYISKIELTFKELEKERIVTANKLATAKIVSENLNHVRDLVFENMDLPERKQLLNQETVFFTFVTTCINDLKLNLLTVHPIEPVVAGRITTYGYDISLEGDFFKFGELCSKFENSRRIVSIKSFTVELVSTQTSEEAQKVSPKKSLDNAPANKIVRVKMRVEAYRVKKVAI